MSHQFFCPQQIHSLPQLTFTRFATSEPMPIHSAATGNLFCIIKPLLECAYIHNIGLCREACTPHHPQYRTSAGTCAPPHHRSLPSNPCLKNTASRFDAGPYHAASRLTASNLMFRHFATEASMLLGSHHFPNRTYTPGPNIIRLVPLAYLYRRRPVGPLFHWNTIFQFTTSKPPSIDLTAFTGTSIMAHATYTCPTWHTDCSALR